jgi:hypothetical protein
VGGLTRGYRHVNTLIFGGNNFNVSHLTGNGGHAGEGFWKWPVGCHGGDYVSWRLNDALVVFILGMIKFYHHSARKVLADDMGFYPTQS